MSPPSTLRGIIATTLASFALAANALPQPAPQAQETVAPSPKVWVHVDGSTKGTTNTPTVTTDASGAKHTDNAPPAYLIQSKAYSTWKDDGLLATYTSLNPAPTASGISRVDDPRGEFLACLPQQSRDEPFCAPKRDAILKPDRGYYITWNTLYFGSPNQRVQILLETAEVDESVAGRVVPEIYSNTSAPLPTFPILTADQGFAFFPLARFVLPFSDSQAFQLTRLNITMAVWASGNYDEDAPTEVKQGPLVYVTNDYDSDSDDESDDEDDLVSSPGVSTGKKIAISVPVAIVSLLVLGGLIAFAVWGYRKNGTVPFVGGLFGKRRENPRSGGSGYGVRKSYSERVGKKGVVGVEEGVFTNTKGAGGGVELTDRESWSPTSPTSARLGGEPNVFRAEVQRQERAREDRF